MEIANVLLLNGFCNSLWYKGYEGDVWMKRKMRIWAMIMVCVIALSGCGEITTRTIEEVETTAPSNEGAKQSRKKSSKTDQVKVEFDEEVVVGNVSKKREVKVVADQQVAITFGCVTESKRMMPEESATVYQEQSFVSPEFEALSTFGLDVDTASYTRIRKSLMEEKMLPHPDAVRIEEMVNYFDYEGNKVKSGETFSIYSEVGECPWQKNHKLLQILLKGKNIERDENMNHNLVFLLDVSGSMDHPDKLPLLKQAFDMLLEQLSEDDRVSIVVYAGAAGIVADGLSAKNKDQIGQALSKLEAGGSTAGGEGIELAYNIAKKHYMSGGNNRVILATDGDFNVGISSESELKDFIEQKRESGVFLSVLGFGDGIIGDRTMETLADYGNGQYGYIDSILEAEKMLVKELSGTLVTIAKDVKFQVEFNPGKVGAYRLIGYDNRRLATEDFDDDQKDSGDLGSGHSVVAYYEIIPREVLKDSDTRYQKGKVTNQTYGNEWAYLKLRYKNPKENKSQLLQQVINEDHELEEATKDFQFGAAVIEAGLLLKDSEYKGEASWVDVIERGFKNKGEDKEGYRSQFIRIAETAKRIMY